MGSVSTLSEVNEGDALSYAAAQRACMFRYTRSTRSHSALTLRSRKPTVAHSFIHRITFTGSHALSMHVVMHSWQQYKSWG